MGRGRRGAGRQGLVVAGQRVRLAGATFADGTPIVGFAGNGGNTMLDARRFQPGGTQRQAFIDNDLAHTVTNARYARGQMAVRVSDDQGWKTTAARVAESVNGRWSNRERAYIMSPGAYTRFLARLEGERTRLEAM